MKSLEELINTNSSWALLQDWTNRGSNPVKVLPKNQDEYKKVLHTLQVTTKSLLGTVAYFTGGILFANGWLRLLGSGNKEVPRNIVSWNHIKGPSLSVESRLPGALLIADDVIGGFFALNGGVFNENVGDVYYLPPDTLEWEDLEMPYSDFLNWCCFGDINLFYKDMQWENWEKQISKIGGDEGISFYPPLWTNGNELNNRSRSVVPIEELWELKIQLSKLQTGE